MRRIHLVRHGRPDFPLEQRLCIGRTDLPLGALGRMQACRTAVWQPQLRALPVFSSPLLRARETARFFAPDFTILPDLRELDAGDWDGLDFDEIRRRWPELYAARGYDMSIPIPNAEPAEAVRRRARKAVDEALAASTGDIVIVAHNFVIRSLLHLTENPPPDADRLQLPYASVTTLCAENGALTVEAIGRAPELPLTPALAEKLLEAAAPGERIEAHCRAVAKEAARIAEALPVEPDTALLESAALLHDIARAEKDHAETAAAWLRALGYDRAAEIAALHHDHDGAALNEAAILFLADKCVAEDRVVSLEERFRKSEEKCRTEEAREAHARRFAAARALKERINTLCETEVIP